MAGGSIPKVNPRTSKFQLNTVERLEIPREMSLLNLLGRAFVHGRKFGKGELDCDKPYNPAEVAAYYSLPEVCIATSLEMPPGTYAEELSSGTLMLNNVYTLFRDVEREVRAWKSSSNDRVMATIRVRAQTYLTRFQNVVMDVMSGLLNDEVFAGRAEDSMIGRIVNAPGCPYYGIMIPEEQAKSCGIRNGDMCITLRWPVLRDIHVIIAYTWNHRVIGFPPTLYDTTNADNDGDLAAVVRVPEKIRAACPDPAEFGRRYAKLKGEYLNMSFGLTPDPCMPAAERLTLARMSTNGSSISLANLEGQPGDFDMLSGATLVQPPEYFQSRMLSPSEHAAKCRETSRQLGFMKALIGPIGRTHRALMVVCQDVVPDITGIFADIEQNGLNVGKHGAQMEWGPIAEFINRGKFLGKPFDGTAEEWAKVLGSLILQHIGFATEERHLLALGRSLYRYKMFPRHGGLNEIISYHFPDYNFLLLTKSTSPGPTAWWSLISAEYESSIPSEVSISTPLEQPDDL